MGFFACGFAPLDFLTGGTPFPGGIVPASRIDPLAQSALAAIPIPSNAGAGANGTVGGTGVLPADGHITFAALGLTPPTFGGFTNLAYVKGTYTVNFTLTVDAVRIASSTGTYTIQ